MINIFFIIIIYMLFSHFLGYAFWSSTKGPILLYITYTILLILFVTKFNKIFKSKDIIDIIILCFIFIPFTSICYSLLINNFSFEYYRSNILISLSSLSYFALKILKVRESQIILSFIILGLITFSIQLYQTFLGGTPLFGIIGDEFNEGIQRNNIFRFYVGSYFLSIFCVYLFWNKIILDLKIKDLFLFCCFIFSMYLYLTRQIIASSVITIFFSVFLITGKKKKVALFLMLLLFILSIIYYDEIFSSFVESHKEDSYSTDIRWIAISFIIEKILEDPLGLILGFGHTPLELLWAKKGIYLNDIGLLGEGYIYGLFWIVLYIKTLYIFLIKKRKIIPLYIRLFLVGTFINSIFIFPYRSPIEVFIWICALYIGRLYIEKSKKHNLNGNITERTFS